MSVAGDSNSEKGYHTQDVAVLQGEQNVNRKAAERFGVFAPVMEKLFDYGVEARGVERVLENERDPKLLWNKYVYSPIFIGCSPDRLHLACLCGGMFPIQSCSYNPGWRAFNRSVNCVLTTIPIGTLAQEYYTLTFG